MKLDKDAVRTILLAVEADTSSPMKPKGIEVPDLSHEEVSYHVQLLAEAGFLEAKRDNQNNYWHPLRLTFAGHEYLDTVRDNEVWRLTKEGASKIGDFSLAALLELAKGILKQKAIEHGYHF